jgi:hypothetical protein
MMDKKVQLEEVKAMTDEIEEYFSSLSPQTRWPVEVDTMVMIEQDVKKIMLEHVKHMIKYMARS